MTDSTDPSQQNRGKIKVSTTAGQLHNDSDG